LILDIFFFIVCSVLAVVVLSATTKSQVNANAKDKLLTQKVSDNNVPDFHAFNWRLCKVLIQFKNDYRNNQINFLNQ